MRYILFLLAINSHQAFSQLKPMSDAYLSEDYSSPTLSYKINKDKFVNLSEAENPFVEGTIDKNSALYAAVQQDKEATKLGVFRYSGSSYVTREKLNSFTIQIGGCGEVLGMPELNSASFLLIGLTTLLFTKRK